MNPADLSQALDLSSRALAVIVSAVGLFVAVSQWTRPAILTRREKWLREAIQAEQNPVRRSTLSGLLTDTTALMVAGIQVPGWRFVALIVLMLFGPVQAFIWAQRDASVWGVVLAVVISLTFTANPIRMAIRLLAERYRVAYEYRQGTQAINPPRVGMLNLNEGGTRREFLFAVLIAVAINVGAVSVALAFLGLALPSLLTGLAAIVGLGVLARIVNGYARARVNIYGPWSVKDASM